MRYLVNWTVTPEAGLKIEAQPGGPGPIIGRIVERFKPEQMYFTPTRREAFMVANFDKPEDIAELMLAAVQICGAYPTFTPVVTLQEFGVIAPKIIPAAQKLAKG